MMQSRSSELIRLLPEPPEGTFLPLQMDKTAVYKNMFRCVQAYIPGLATSEQLNNNLYSASSDPSISLL